MKARVMISDYEKLVTKELVELVTKEYHVSMRSSFALVLTLLDAARKVEPEHAEMEMVYEHVRRMADDFAAHAGKEERFLFPLLAKATPLSPADHAELKIFIAQLENEHRRQHRAHDLLKIMTHGYYYDTAAGPSHKLAYARLHNLAEDFSRSVFVEEEYLFPRLQPATTIKIAKP